MGGVVELKTDARGCVERCGEAPAISGSSVRRARNRELNSTSENGWAAAGVELAVIVAVTSVVVDVRAVLVRTDTLAALVILSEYDLLVLWTGV